MNLLTLGFTPHYYLNEIAIEIWILDHLSNCKSDAMLLYSLSFSYMLIGALCLLNQELVFHRTVPQSRDSTYTVLTDSHGMFVLLCNSGSLSHMTGGYLISDDAFLFKQET